MVLPSSGTELFREALAFLQRRVSLFGLVGGGLGGGSGVAERTDARGRGPRRRSWSGHGVVTAPAGGGERHEQRLRLAPQASAPTAATAESTSSGVFRMLPASRAKDWR